MLQPFACDDGEPASANCISSKDASALQVPLERLLDAEEGVCFGHLFLEHGRDWHIGVRNIRHGDETLVISFETRMGKSG